LVPLCYHLLSYFFSTSTAMWYAHSLRAAY
jgi:hypothetical protein